MRTRLAQVLERAVQLRVAADAVRGDVGQQLGAVRQRIGGVLRSAGGRCRDYWTAGCEEMRHETPGQRTSAAGLAALS